MTQHTALNKENNFVSIVVNYRNSKQKIVDFLMSTAVMFEHNFKCYEYVIVNTTPQSIKSEIGSMSNAISGSISVINFPWQQSLETALAAGVDLAIGDFVYEFDNIQINYPVELLYEAYQKALEGYDIVAVSPDSKESITSRLFYSLLSRVSYQRMRLSTESFRVVSRRAINRVTEFKTQLMYRKALYHYCGLDTFQYNYSANNKKIKLYHLGFTERLRLATNIIIGYSNMGTRIAASLSVMFLGVALAAGVYTLFSYFFRNEIQSGWTTTMLFLSISFSGIFFILAILSEYMASLLAEMKNKNAYLVKSIEKLPKNS